MREVMEVARQVMAGDHEAASRNWRPLPPRRRGTRGRG